MKQLITTLAATAMFAASASAQVVLTGGFGSTGMGIVNGNTYSKTGSLGSGGFAFVSASNDGTKFFASAPNDSMFYTISVASMSFTDSLKLLMRNLASSNETNILFTINDRCMIRFNTSTMSVVDSIYLGSPWLLEERPGAKEVWVSDSGKIHVVDYTTGLSKNTMVLTSSPYDYGGVRFTPGGAWAYKGAGTTKRIYKINAVTKTVVDSANTPSYSPGAVVVSHDSSKLFVCDPGNSKIMVYNTSSMALIDSINCGTRAPMNIYRHPSRAEIWAVNHFRDSITVYNENTHALIAAFNCSGSPWYIAFSSGTTGVNDPLTTDNEFVLFPNPATDMVVVGLPDNRERMITILDNTGRLVKSVLADAAYVSVHVADLAPGNYYVNIADKGKEMKTLRFTRN